MSRLRELIPPFLPHLRAIVSSVLDHRTLLNASHNRLDAMRTSVRNSWDAFAAEPLVDAATRTRIFLVGVSHALPESSLRVKGAMERFEPDGVALELDPPRYSFVNQVAGFLASGGKQPSDMPFHIRLNISPANRRIFKRTQYLPMSEFIAALPPRVDPAVPPPLRIPVGLIDLQIDQLVLPILYPPAPPPTPASVRARKIAMQRAAVEGPLPADQALYTHLPLNRSRQESSRLRRELEERVESLRTYLGQLRESYGLEVLDFEPPGRQFWQKWIDVRIRLRSILLGKAAGDNEERSRIELAWPAFPVADLCGDFWWAEPIRLCEDLRTPDDMRVLTDLQLEMLPRWHHWGIGLRDAVMGDMVRGFCARLDELRPDKGGMKNVVAVVGKSHVWGIRRMWERGVPAITTEQAESSLTRGRFLFNDRPAGIPEPVAVRA